jgi:cyclase
MQQKNSYKKGGMFEGALHTVFENAKFLRNNMTDAEKVLWMHLKTGVNGCKFRRQHPIGMYIADFYCHKAKLVVEVDGSIHNLAEVRKKDEDKQIYLANAGYSILRFTNQEVGTKLKKSFKKYHK